MATKKTTAKKAARRRRRTAAAPGTLIAELTTERMLLTDLEEHPRNSEIRNHPEPGTAKWRELEISLGHDYYDPLVFNTRNGYLVSGHLRRKVLIHMGYTHADVVVVDYDDTTHMARMLSANRTVGSDDEEGVRGFWMDFATLPNFVPELAGFTTADVRGILPNANVPWLNDVNEEDGDDEGGSWEDHTAEDTEGDEHSGNVLIRVRCPIGMRAEAGSVIAQAIEDLEDVEIET